LGIEDYCHQQSFRHLLTIARHLIW